uniref:Uncharacterized protein n=1 Tax=Megaselia scalaris TaxID=36166 RepID=T1GCC2_MEGSC
MSPRVHVSIPDFTRISFSVPSLNLIVISGETQNSSYKPNNTARYSEFCKSSRSQGVSERFQTLQHITGTDYENS